MPHLLLPILACREVGPNPEVDLPAWEGASFGPDAFPPSEDTVHDVARETGGLIPETGAGGAAANFTVQYGLFTWQHPYEGDDSVALGILSLHEEIYGCRELFGEDPSYYYPYQFGNKPSPDDLSWYVFAETPDSFVGTYADCGKGQDCFLGYWYLDDGFGQLDGTLTIESVDDHYVTVSWENAVLSGGPFTVYNCGDRRAWQQ